MEMGLKMADARDEIHIENVTEELDKLGSEGKKKGQIKGCLFNLIVYSQDPYRSIFLKEIVQIVTETFPCRIIFIECDNQTKKNFLDVTVEEQIVKKDSLVISCDRININCSAKFLNRVPYIVLPHFVPDLPIILVWGQDPSEENEILPYLETFASRLIFDSDSSCNISAFCRKMLSDTTLNKIAVTDMNWASLKSWREILFQIFDSQEKIEQLRHCNQIEILFNNKIDKIYQHTERRPLYLQAWLAAQLGWQYSTASRDENGIKIIYDNHQGQTVVSIKGVDMPDLTPGAIVGVKINAQNDIIFDLRRMSAQHFIKAYITTKEACALPITLPLRHSKRGLNFMNEIFFAHCSEHYWSMLKALEPLQVTC